MCRVSRPRARFTAPHRPRAELPRFGNQHDIFTIDNQFRFSSNKGEKSSVTQIAPPKTPHEKRETAFRRRAIAESGSDCDSIREFSSVGETFDRRQDGVADFGSAVIDQTLNAHQPLITLTINSKSRSSRFNFCEAVRPAQPVRQIIVDSTEFLWCAAPPARAGRDRTLRSAERRPATRVACREKHRHDPGRRGAEK